MKLTTKKLNKTDAFTIIELLTVMSIIVILITLLAPSLNMVKRHAKKVKQRAQFHSIDVAMDLYNAEWEGYPDSEEKDEDGVSYCGAMKLCEAMMGQDLKGFHPASRFRNDGMSGGASAIDLYPDKDQPTPIEYVENVKARRGPHLQLDNANAYKVKHLYGVGNTTPFTGEEFVLCDVYKRITLQPDEGDPTDKIHGTSGTPILYFKADLSKTTHNVLNENDSQNMYDYKDNDELVQLGIPWATSFVHPIDSTGGTTSTDDTSTPKKFYENTLNEKIRTLDRPYRPDSYILLSAGFDGEYGTDDDIFNFEK